MFEIEILHKKLRIVQGLRKYSEKKAKLKFFLKIKFKFLKNILGKS